MRVSIFLVCLVGCCVLPTFNCFAGAMEREHNPKILIVDTDKEVGERCAKKIADLVKENNAAGVPTVLGLATGSTPVPVYEAFIELYRHDTSLDLSRVITFNLDEYLGLASDDPQSYHHFMFKNLFVDELLYSEDNPRGIKVENIHIPDGHVAGELTLEQQLSVLSQRAYDYEDAIQTLGPIDLQLLGIGENGHIGFAEPGSPLDGETMLVRLDDNTREVNGRFFDSDVGSVPRRAMTMGIGTILRAKEIVLLATGPRKRDAVDKALNGPVTSDVPASVLRRHPRVTFLLDTQAAR